MPVDGCRVRRTCFIVTLGHIPHQPSSNSYGLHTVGDHAYYRKEEAGEPVAGYYVEYELDAGLALAQGDQGDRLGPTSQEGPRNMIFSSRPMLGSHLKS